MVHTKTTQFWVGKKIAVQWGKFRKWGKWGGLDHVHCHPSGMGPKLAEILENTKSKNTAHALILLPHKNVQQEIKSLAAGRGASVEKVNAPS